MRLGILESAGLVFLDSFLIYEIAKKIIFKVNRNSLILLIGAGALLVCLHLSLFLGLVKETNYYELLEVDRAYSTEVLNKKAKLQLSLHHPDKSNDGGEQFMRISQIRNILLDQQLSKMYDSLGGFTKEMNEVLQLKNMQQKEQLKERMQFQADVEVFSFYSILFIVQIVTSYGGKYSKYRIVSTILIVIMFAQELYTIYQAGQEIEDKSESYPDESSSKKRVQKFEVSSNFFDIIFPSYTTYEVMQLLRLLLLSELTIARLFYDVTVQEEKNVMEIKLNGLINSLFHNLAFQAKQLLQPTIPEQDKDLPKGQQIKHIFSLDLFIANHSLVNDINKAAIQYRKQQLNDSKLISIAKKVFKYGILALFVYSVLGNILNKENKREG